MPQKIHSSLIFCNTLPRILYAMRIIIMVNLNFSCGFKDVARFIPRFTLFQLKIKHSVYYLTAGFHHS